MYSEMREEARDHARVRNVYFEQVCLVCIFLEGYYNLQKENKRIVQIQAKTLFSVSRWMEISFYSYLTAIFPAHSSKFLAFPASVMCCGKLCPRSSYLEWGKDI